MWDLRGFLMRAVSDFTVLIATCFAFRPTLTAVSESEDTDHSDGIRPRLWLAMVEYEGIIFWVICTIYTYKLYSFDMICRGCRWRVPALPGMPDMPGWCRVKHGDPVPTPVVTRPWDPAQTRVTCTKHYSWSINVISEWAITRRMRTRIIGLVGGRWYGCGFFPCLSTTIFFLYDTYEFLWASKLLRISFNNSFSAANIRFGESIPWLLEFQSLAHLACQHCIWQQFYSVHIWYIW